MCKNEVLAVEVDKELAQIYLSMYRLTRKSSFLNKLKMIWYIIRKGHPYIDSIILDSNTVKDLAMTLMSYYKEVDK